MSKKRACLCLVFLFLCALAARLPAGEEQELADALMRQLAGFTAIVLENMDPDKPGVCYPERPNDHYTSPCYALAYLYKTEHPLNPYCGRREIRDHAVAICDHIVKIGSILEWPLYNLCQVFELLRDELDKEHIRRWREYAAYYIRARGIRPYFYTSPNHEAWNAVAVLRAGQVFENPDWEEQGRRLMHQLLKLQTELGYWDEGPHHGPSMKYNQLQLAAMLLFADYANDKKVLAAGKKLADFIIRYSFPDGSPIGAFDGRQSWSLGYFGTLLYGLDRWPKGKELNRRIFSTRKRWGILDPQSPHYNFSDWYAYFGCAFIMDEYLSLRPEASSSALPQDANGYLRVDKGPSFAGGAARCHDWMVALSAINSDISRISGSAYRLERQSRLDLWHEKTGLIIGGGHNIKERDMPLANFHLVTGYKGVDCDFGLLSGGSYYDKQAVYFPRNVKADITIERQALRAAFGQGDISFTVVPLDREHLKVIFEYDVFSVKKLFVQLPLVIFYNSSVLINGRPFEGDRVQKVTGWVQISNPTTGTTVRISVPEGYEAALRPSVPPLRWYDDNQPRQRYIPYYGISLLSVRVDQPQGAGCGEFMVEIMD